MLDHLCSDIFEENQDIFQKSKIFGLFKQQSRGYLWKCGVNEYQFHYIHAWNTIKATLISFILKIFPNNFVPKFGSRKSNLFIPETDDGSWQWWEWNHWLSRILGSDVKGVFNNQIIITLKYYSVHWQLSLRRGDHCSLQSVWPWWWWLSHSRMIWYTLEIRKTFFFMFLSSVR